MKVKEIVVGKERFTAAHLLLFTESEGRAFFGDAWSHLRRLAEQARPSYKPLTLEVEVCPGRRVLVGPGSTLISGVEAPLEAGLEVPPLLDEEFLMYLLFDAPRALDGLRRAVVVESLDERFTRDVEEGLRYAVDIMSRLGLAYRVPVVATGGVGLVGLSFSRRIVTVRDEEATVVYVDGEPFCRPV